VKNKGPALLFLLGLWQGLLSPAAAETDLPESFDVPDLPAGITLPEPARQGFTPARISRADLQNMQPVILPELQEWVRSGVLEFEAARRLRYAWRYDDEWHRSSAEPQIPAPSPAGTLPEDFTWQRGFVFGEASVL